MKNLIKNTEAVSYLILVGIGLTVVVTGIAYNLISDFVDLVISSINGYSGTLLANQMDADSLETGSLLLMTFKLVLLPSLIAIIYFALTMSQKQQRNW